MYQELFNELEKIYLAKTGDRNNRLNFPFHRRGTFGWTRGRFNGKYDISEPSKKWPHIYQMLLDIGSKICKHNFTSIHVIKNLVSPKHKDSNNVGISTIVSFGNYTGCKLVIEGEIKDAYENPIEFNGYEKTHWNTNDLQGTKYSLIFFNIKLPDNIFPYQIAIPSYKRSKICNEQTLATLHNNNIPKHLINVFVVADEYDEYKKTLNPNYYNRIIIGHIGLVHQHHFITRYYIEGTHLIEMDDDIREIDLQYTDYENLDIFLKKAFEKCIEENVYLFSVNPVYNPFWREKKLPIKKTNLNFCIGAFFGIIVRHDEDLQMKLCIEGNKEDVERSILYYLKDGRTLVFNRIGFKTKYFAGDGGGLGKLKDRIEIHKIQTQRLCEKYPELCKSKVRKNGLWEVVFKKC